MESQVLQVQWDLGVPQVTLLRGGVKKERGWVLTAQMYSSLNERDEFYRLSSLKGETFLVPLLYHPLSNFASTISEFHYMHFIHFKLKSTSTDKPFLKLSAFSYNVWCSSLAWVIWNYLFWNSLSLCYSSASAWGQSGLDLIGGLVSSSLPLCEEWHFWLQP